MSTKLATNSTSKHNTRSKDIKIKTPVKVLDKVDIVKTKTVPQNKTVKATSSVITYSNLDLYEKIVSLENLILSLQKEILEIKTSPGVSSQVNSLMKENTQLKSEINSLKSIGGSVCMNRSEPTEADTVTPVSKSIDHLERQSLDSQLIISGLPVAEEVNCMEVIKSVSRKINCEFESSDIVDIFQTNHPTNAKQVFVKFKEIEKRNLFFKSYLKSKTKVQQNDVLRNGCPVRLYVNEVLTKQNYNIFLHARNLQKDKKIDKLFTKSGIVCVVDNGSSVYRKIFNINQLN